MKNKIFYKLALAVCAACMLLSMAVFAHGNEYSLIEGGYVRVLGRGDIKGDEADQSRTFNWPNAGFEFVFEGMKAEVYVNEEKLVADDDAKGNYFTMAVYDETDGLVRTERLELTEGWNLFYKYRPGDPLIKKVKLVRSSEGYYGTVTMSKIRTDASPKASADREILIESIGDSYTAGCGNLASAGSEPSTGQNTDNWYSYATVMARYFGADNNILAISGNGVVTNNGWEAVDSRHNVMKEQVKFSEPQYASVTNMSERETWIQSGKKADLVTVWLGTNDGDSERKTVSDEEFENGYYELLTAMEEMHPGAEFICMAEPTNRWYSIIKNIVSEKKKTGKGYYFHAVTRKGKNGGTYHPNKQEAGIIAEDLIHFIKETGILKDRSAGDFSVNVDYNTGEVSVYGRVSDAMAGDAVAALVTEKNTDLTGLTGDDIKWCGQTTTNKNGEWRFSFRMKAADMSGEYTYTMKAPTMEANAGKEFSFKNVIPGMSVQKGDVLVDRMSQLSEGDVLSVTVSGFDLEDGESGSLIVAQYDANGGLISAEVKDASTDSQEYGSAVTKDVTIAPGAGKIRAYYWETDKLVPFMGAYVIE